MPGGLQERLGVTWTIGACGGRKRSRHLGSGGGDVVRVSVNLPNSFQIVESKWCHADVVVRLKLPAVVVGSVLLPENPQELRSGTSSLQGVQIPVSNDCRIVGVSEREGGRKLQFPTPLG